MQQKNPPQSDTKNNIRQGQPGFDKPKSQSPAIKPSSEEGDVSKVYERPTTAHDAQMNPTKDV